MPSPKSHTIGEDFVYLIAHIISCTLESEDVSAMDYGGLNFGSLDEDIKVEDLLCFDNTKGMPKKGLLEWSSSMARSSKQQIQCSSFWNPARPGQADYITQKHEYSFLFLVCSGPLGFFPKAS